ATRPSPVVADYATEVSAWNSYVSSSVSRKCVRVKPPGPDCAESAAPSPVSASSGARSTSRASSVETASRCAIAVAASSAPLAVESAASTSRRRPAAASMTLLMSDPLDDARRGLGAARAHRDQGAFAAGALELVQGGGDEPRPGTADGVADRDGAPVDVDLVHIGPMHLRPA